MHYRYAFVGLTRTRKAALERYDLSCTYLADHEVQSFLLDIVIDYCWGFTGDTVDHILQSNVPQKTKFKLARALCQPCVLTNHSKNEALKIDQLLSVLIGPYHVQL